MRTFFNISTKVNRKKIFIALKKHLFEDLGWQVVTDDENFELALKLSRKEGDVAKNCTYVAITPTLMKHLMH